MFILFIKSNINTKLTKNKCFLFIRVKHPRGLKHNIAIQSYLKINKITIDILINTE